VKPGVWNFIEGVEKPPERGNKRVNDNNYDANKRVRSFQDSWRRDYPWLVHDEENDVMKCEVGKIDHALDLIV
jgi:hypothetical protein